jgi:hypothetical protein
MENPLLTLEDWNRALSSMTTWEEVVDLWAKNRHNGSVRENLPTPVAFGGIPYPLVGEAVKAAIIRLGGGYEPGRLMVIAAQAWDEETGYWEDTETPPTRFPSPQVLELLKRYYPVQYNYWMRRIK